MKLVNELFNMYKHKLGDEEDADIITFAVLEELSRDDLVEIIQEMDDQEIFDMVGLYLMEMLKGKMAQEGMRGKTVDYKNLH